MPTTLKIFPKFVTKSRPRKSDTAPDFSTLFNPIFDSRRLSDYRESAPYPITSSEDENELELLETNESVIDLSTSFSETLNETQIELVDTPETVKAPSARANRKELRTVLKRKSHEHRLAQFNSQRKKKNCTETAADLESFENLIDSHISELHFETTKETTKDVDASFLLTRRLPPLERASEMFFARSIVPLPPVAAASKPSSSSSRLITKMCLFLTFIFVVVSFLILWLK